MFLCGFIRSASFLKSFILSFLYNIPTLFSLPGTLILPEDLPSITAFSNAHYSNFKFSLSTWKGQEIRADKSEFFSQCHSSFQSHEKSPHFLFILASYIFPRVGSQVKNSTFIETFCSWHKIFTYILILFIAINDPSFMISSYLSAQGHRYAYKRLEDFAKTSTCLNGEGKLSITFLLQFPDFSLSFVFIFLDSLNYLCDFSLNIVLLSIFL